MLDPDAVASLLRGRFGRPYRYLTTCVSTQLVLEPDDPEGAVAVCDEQSAGRGRLGRSWQAPPGTAILCSIVLRPPLGRRAAELSLVGGLAAAETVEVALDLSSQIKWPNDVMVNRRKVAGVLAEAHDGSVVLGIGVNVNQQRDELPADAKVPPASLRTIDARERDRGPLLADLLLRLEHAYDAWREGGLEPLYGELGARDFLRGRRVSVDGVAGVGAGIDRSGGFELSVGDEIVRVESGDVTYER